MEYVASNVLPKSFLPENIPVAGDEVDHIAAVLIREILPSQIIAELFGMNYIVECDNIILWSQVQLESFFIKTFANGFKQDIDSFHCVSEAF